MFSIKKQSSWPRLSVLPLLTLFGVFILSGCNTVVMNPSGDIARQQADLILVSTGLMLLIIVPVIVLTCVFAWKYRQANTQAEYDPEWDHSTKLELVIWGAPLLIIIVLGLITWVSTHKLDPYRPLDRIDENTPIAAHVKPMEVQVVAMDWKWLFIYPEQGVATVNELVTPINTPVRFKITASSVMNSFFIPALAGQIYAMPGMETTLHAVMNEVGEYEGFSANYSGAGFSHMRFKYRGVSESDFADWVKTTKANGGEMSRKNYIQLESPSIKEPAKRFAKVDANLFHAIVNRCVQEGTVCMDKQMAMDARRNTGLGGVISADSISFLIDQAACRVARPDELVQAKLEASVQP